MRFGLREEAERASRRSGALEKESLQRPQPPNGNSGVTSKGFVGIFSLNDVTRK
jgi:hypothetical protein